MNVKTIEWLQWLETGELHNLVAFTSEAFDSNEYKLGGAA
jgi:hypothetical protein